MADQYAGPFGTYTNVEIIIAAAQAEVIANINSFKALFNPVPSDSSAAKPMWDKIPPETRDRINAELDAMIVIIDAAPEA